MNITHFDLGILAVYAVGILSLGLYASRSKKGETRSAEDYFLAGKKLPWWTIGASLIAANISAEQFIGISGSGFAMGLAIASYEWIAALTLIVVGKYFLPVFIKTGIYTIPEFIERRYGVGLKSILAIFWIAVFIFVNLTSVLYLGAKALDTVIGSGDGSLLMVSIIGLALFAAAYSIWGGLSAVAWTDMVQVVLLVVGGVFVSCIALDKLSDGHGVLAGLTTLYDTLPKAKFSMILSKGENIMPNGQDAYNDLPGLSVLLGGLWIANFYYWGFNQYIIQRALAAKSLKEAQKGIVFSAALKMIIPFLVVIPGMVAYAMMNKDMFGAHAAFTQAGATPDMAYPWLIQQFVPVGFKGLVLAALAAAIVSSLASMLNSTATIFTMDIYKPYINKKANDTQLVVVGRVTAIVALLIACTIAPMLGQLDQAYQYIQEYTGLVTPGIFAVFLLGLTWKKTTNMAAQSGAIFSIVVALVLKAISKQVLDAPLPWMREIEITFVLTMIFMIIFSLIQHKGKDDPKAITITKEMSRTDIKYNLVSFAIVLVFAAIYVIFN